MTETLTIQQTNSTGIQAALDKVGEDQEYDALRLSAGVYNINKPLYMNSGTEIFGPKTAILKLMANAPATLFRPLVPIFGQKKTTIHDISIHGFCFDGRSDKQTVKWGKGYHDFVYLTDAKNIDVHNVIMRKSQGDGLRFKRTENIDVSGCTFDKIGHDGLYTINCDTVNFFANTVTLRTNSGCRTANTNHVKIFDNAMSGSNNWWAGGGGVQIDHNDYTIVDDVEVYDNVFYQTYGPCFWLSNYGAASTDLSLCKDYKIHDNLIVECGLNPNIDWTAGFMWSGVDNVLFEYNTVVDCGRFGIAAHVGSSVFGTKPAGKGYNLIARNNIVCGTKLNKFKGGYSANGYGIANTLFVTHSVTSEENAVWGNAAGNYFKVSSESDYIDPIELDEKYIPKSVTDCGCRMN